MFLTGHMVCLIDVLSHLVYVQLLQEIQISSLTTQIPAGHRLHPLLLQNIHHIIERILIRQSRQRLIHTSPDTSVCVCVCVCSLCVFSLPY